jgi:quercetin dioxygenase-like cupin family protein
MTMTVKHIQEIDRTVIPDAKGVTRKMLISPEEAPNFAMRCFTIQPGGGIPNHFNRVEHEQYVLNGQARIGIGNEVFEVHAGDIVFIPAEVPHWYTNTGEEPFEFLCLVPNKEDATVWLK